MLRCEKLSRSFPRASSIPPAMARSPVPPIDPAADAAGLLRRLGFAILMLFTPLAALITRRGVVVLVPIGVALLVIASVLDGANRPLVATLKGIGASVAGTASALLFGWCALSLAWTPFPAPAAERIGNIAATLGVVFAGYLALPDRMRSANLYLLPVGVAAAAVAAIGLALLGPEGGRALNADGQSLARGLVVLVLFVWPSVAWLRSRGREIEALGLAVAVALAAIVFPEPMPLIALGVGGIVFALTSSSPALGTRLTAVVLAGALALAPLFPLIVRPVANLFFNPSDPVIASLRVWRNMIFSDPLRLVTGYGFETALRGRAVGLLPVNAPQSLLFEIWYELGVVGAFAGAVALFFGVIGSGRDHPPLVPGVMAAFAGAFALAVLGIGTTEMWWFTALATLLLVFVAAERGQFRTKRPKAVLRLRAANDA